VVRDDSFSFSYCIYNSNYMSTWNSLDLLDFNVHMMLTKMCMTN
jgi:hypothetical protein